LPGGKKNKMYKYLAYKPKDGDALVRVGRETLHSSSKKALFADTERYLVDITWIKNMSWRNDTNVVQTYSHTFTTQLKITQGSEVNKGFSVPVTYAGTSISFNKQTKTFKTTETTESRTVTLNVSVPPRSLLVFYQRKYTFRDSVFPFFKNGNQEWNIGSGEGYEPTSKDIEVEIMSEEYATLSKELDGSKTGKISVTTVDPSRRPSNTQKRRKIPRRARKILGRMGV